MVVDSQSLVSSRSPVILLCLRTRVVPLRPSDPEDEDVSLQESDLLVRSTRLDIGEGDGVRRARVVGEGGSVSSVVRDHVEEDSSASDTVCGPVVDSNVEVGRVNLHRVLDVECSRLDLRRGSSSVEASSRNDSKVS